MTLQEIAEQILHRAKALNEQLQDEMDTIGLEASRKLESTIREAEGWLMGCRKMVE